MLESGDHTWNSGMFVWRVDTVMAEFARQMPDLNSKLAEISEAWDQPQSLDVISRVWPTIQPETIDSPTAPAQENLGHILPEILMLIIQFDQITPGYPPGTWRDNSSVMAHFNPVSMGKQDTAGPASMVYDHIQKNFRTQSMNG